MPDSIFTKYDSWEQVADGFIDKMGYDRGFKKWFLDRKFLGVVGDYGLYARAYKIYNELRNDWDHPSVVFGVEGSGKSTLAIQLCSLISPHSFSQEYVCYELSDLIRVLRIVKKGDSILLDEGGMFLFSRNALKSDVIDTIKMFQIIRQKNIHFCICIPNIKFLDTYFRSGRIKTLLRVLGRGRYIAYTGNNIPAIAQHYSKNFSLNNFKPFSDLFWTGHFRKDVCRINGFGMDTYKAGKDSHLSKYLSMMREEYSQEGSNGKE